MNSTSASRDGSRPSRAASDAEWESVCLLQLELECGHEQQSGHRGATTAFPHSRIVSYPIEDASRARSISMRAGSSPPKADLHQIKERVRGPASRTYL